MAHDITTIGFFAASSFFAIVIGLLRARLRSRVVRQERKLGPSSGRRDLAALPLRERFVN